MKPYTWWRIWQLVKSHRRELIIANVIALAAALAAVPVPLLIPLLVDEVLLNQPGTLVGWMSQLFPPEWHGPVLYIGFITLVTIALRLAGLGLGIWQNRNFTLIGKDVTWKIRQDLLARLRHVSMDAYTRLGSGSVSATLVNDVNTLDDFISTTISKLIVAVLSLVGVSAVLLWLNWQLALFILLLNPVVIYFTIALGRKVRELKKRENTALELFQQAVTETLDALQQIRAAGKEQRFFDRLTLLARQVRDSAGQFVWKSDAASRLSFMVFLIGFDLFRMLGMLMVLWSDLTIGEMMAIFGYLWFMMGPVQEILSIQYAYAAASGALQRINSVLALEQEPEPEGHENPFQRLPVGIRVENLTFAYGDNEPVLRDLSFSIAPGEKVAFVGASGGGKTTLVNLMLGFYTPQSGCICYNDVPLARIDRQLLRQKVAVVLQQPVLFDETVRFNLTLGEALSDAQLWQALEMAQAADFVRELPDGLETRVGRNGITLSGGQRQRIAIARMILQDPAVVIMDEATSALDAQTERRLYDALAPWLESRTALIVAHRLTSVLQAERIIVFEDGRIVEHGDHAGLLRQQGTYWRLYGTLAKSTSF
ncbi:ATP-binding cassette, subfamily C [Sulfurivirga caldicuralii]|uniref:ATP-binding cassette, subfamily C n=1 Tax=Sulfurivirga caldicuralii TaxID=364032 RepID=A0A1N6ENG9_9GAMM|nr:ABC transporter ATP-binding protein [Sulfurivirga caldicuralii]SIN84548.1 ATP-binding cassette, subfamily C [Sulfurivirga caldicuralii]